MFQLLKKIIYDDQKNHEICKANRSKNTLKMLLFCSKSPRTPGSTKLALVRFMMEFFSLGFFHSGENAN